MKRTVPIITVTLAFFLLLVVTLLLSIPYLADSYLFPRLLAAMPAVETHMQISRLTPWSLQANLTLGEETAATLSLPRIKISFTPTRILQGTIDTLRLEGATLRLAYTNGQLTLQDINLTPDEETEENLKPLIMPLAVEHLILRDCQVIVSHDTHPNTHLIVSGNFQLQYKQPEKKRYLLQSLQGDLLVQGDQPLAAKISLQPSATGHVLTLSADNPDLARLSRVFPLLEELELRGTTHLDARLSLTEHLRRLQKFSLQLTLPQLHIGSGGITIGQNSSQAPPQFTLSGDLTQMHYSLNNLHTTAPVSAALSLAGDYSQTTGSFTGNGTITPKGLADTIPFVLTGNSSGQKTLIKLQAGGNSRQFKLQNTKVDLGPYEMLVDLALTPDTTAAAIDIRLEYLELADHHLRLQNASLTLPLDFSRDSSQSSPTGTLAINNIKYQQEQVATLSTQLMPKGDSLAFTGKLSSPLNSALQVLFDGEISKPQSLRLAYRIPEVSIDTSLIPSFVPRPPDLRIQGRFLATGNLDLSGHTASGSLQVRLHDGGLELTDKKIHLSGIDFDLSFPFLPRLASAPSQLLTIDTMDIGSLNFTDAKVYFRMEDQQTLFIEKSRLNWCSGKVEGGSMRLSAEKSEISTTLYCDRLKFSELLDQFGITGTEGDGSLNGRLPLHITENGVVFDDGFLFSTPGNSGIVQFNNTQMLRQGMPAMDQAGYLDYSLQALENFFYNWAKLTFNSQGEDLLISMQIDGKPASPLPFGYKNGQIVPHADGQGIQHPIRLDLNFHLPFAEMLKYGHNIQTIMENM